MKEERKKHMKKEIVLKPHFVRKSTHYALEDSNVPKELYSVINEKPELEDFPAPLPSKKSDYTCSVKVGNVLWLGAETGLTRYDPDAEYSFDKVLYFSADRDLKDNKVTAILPDGDGVWVKTETAVTHIELPVYSAKEVSDILLAETLKYVQRHSMVSHKYLARPGEHDSILPYGSCDNDGGFTSQFCLAEIYRYSVLKKEKGADDPETLEALKVAKRALDASMLLMYIHGRGNGFVSRTYSTADEPLPDDGLFFRRQGNKAVALDTSESRERGIVGLEVDCSAPMPDRLKYLYEEDGYTLDDIYFKCDTSSDEITLQVLNLLFAHKELGCDDPELDEFIKVTTENIVSHIIDNGFTLVDYSGEPTTWARWDESYFNSEDGWVDAALNSAELLFYLKAVMEITGETGRWKETYDRLVYERGYADLPLEHDNRLYQISLHDGMDPAEEIMYGDHWLATASLFGLCYLEKDEELLGKYRRAFGTWRGSIEREHDAALDFLYLVACPGEEVDEERVKEWFMRANISRLAAGVSLIGRHDIPVKTLRCGYKETSTLLPQDEKFISKYDRNPLQYKNVDSGGLMCVESCYVYTLSYWMGRYFGFIREGECE